MNLVPNVLLDSFCWIDTSTPFSPIVAASGGDVAASSINNNSSGGVGGSWFNYHVN